MTLHAVPNGFDAPTPKGRIQDGVAVIADGLCVTEPEFVAEAAAAGDELSVGQLCQETLDIGIAVRRTVKVDTDIKRLDEATKRFQAGVDGTVTVALEALQTDVSKMVDPDQGAIAEAVTRELAKVGKELDAAFDANDKQSILTRVTDAVLEVATQQADGTAKKVRQLVDPSNDASPMGVLRSRIVADIKGPVSDLKRSIDEVKTQLQIKEGVAAEAEKGTAKGFTYEDLVEEALESAAIGHGDEFQNVSRVSGAAGNDKGDFVTTIAGSTTRVAWEAKDHTSMNSQAAIRELDGVATNREADVAVMVLSRPTNATKPAPFVRLAPGRFAVHYDKDTRDDLALQVVYQIARFESAANSNTVDHIDIAQVTDKLELIRAALHEITTIKKGLGKITSGLATAQSHIDTLRQQITELLDDLDLLLHK